VRIAIVLGRPLLAERPSHYCQRIQGFPSSVALLHAHSSFCSSRLGADEASGRGLIREDVDHIGATLDLAIRFVKWEPITKRGQGSAR
jgi:hypothetical protein